MKRLLILACLWISGCLEVGNTSTTCTPGSINCVCDGIGNCMRDCPTGGCQFLCRGIGNCDFTCPGGGCQVFCQNTGNCILDSCSGNCNVMCLGNIGNCVCENGCGPDASTAPRDLNAHD
jgi:hypothetical protein